MQATTRARCLPTHTSPCAGSSSLAGQRNPIGSLHETNFPSASRIDQFSSALPLTCSQSDGSTTSGLRKEEREPDLVHPRGCRGECADHATSLQECPGSARSLRFATTRTSQARSTALVAPPYDVISDAQRAEYRARSPYNVVRLTLPDSADEAARDLAAWRTDGVLRDEPSRYWWVAQDYTGPDGVARTREGLAASVPVTPYEEGEVLPHERTHAGPKEGRLRLLRATHTQLEPIFLLYDAEPGSSSGRTATPAMDVEEGGVRTRVWPVDGDELELGTPLLIADGHHRYETAVAYRAENPRATHTFAILVSARSPGVEIFPTHRIVQSVGDVPGDEIDAPDGGVTLYRDGRYVRVATDDDFGPRVVESLQPHGRDVHRVGGRCRRGRRSRRRCGRVPARAGHLRAGGALRPRTRDDAAEVDVLLSEADLGAALPPGTLAAWRPVTRSWRRSGT